jgi:hypothetical protein
VNLNANPSGLSSISPTEYIKELNIGTAKRKIKPRINGNTNKRPVTALRPLKVSVLPL